MTHSKYRPLLINMILFILLWAGCTHTSKTFKINLVHDNENIQFEQEFFSQEYHLNENGDPTNLLGIPAWRDCAQKYEFRFDLNDLSTLYYLYLSIETFEVEQSVHPIYLNKKKLGYLQKSTYQYEGGPTYPRGTPTKFQATQFYLPKELLKTGKNVLEIRHAWPKIKVDKFAIGKVSIVVVHINRGISDNEIRDQKSAKRYFPKDLGFLKSLSDEELYIVMVGVPRLITELNMPHGLHRKKLSYVYSKIGDYYRWKGDYVKNLDYQTKALEAELDEGLSPLVPYFKSSLGLAHYYVGNYDLSIDICKQALEDVKKLDIKQLKKLSSTTYESIHSLNNLINAYIALNYYHLKNYDLAEQYCQKIYHNQEQPVAAAIKYQIQGNIATIRKTFVQATAQYALAIYALKKHPEIYHDLMQNAKLYQANAHYLNGDYQKAVDQISSVEGQTNEFKWKSLQLLGDIARAENNIEQAIEQYIRSIDEIEFSRAKLNVHGFKISFMNDKQEPYRKAISSLVKSDRGEEAFNYTEKAKARAFLDMIAASQDFTDQKSSKFKDLSREEAQLRSKVLNLQLQIDNEQQLFQQRGAGAEAKTELKTAIQSLNNFYLTKAAGDDQFASLNAVGTMTLQGVMKILPEAVSVVEYYYDSNSIYIWVFDNTRYHFLKKDINSAELEHLTKEYRDLVYEGDLIRGVKFIEKSESPRSHGEDQFAKLNGKLSSLLLDGVLNHVKTEKVYIVPHGILHYLPFQSLTYQSDYLIEKYQIGYIPSATTLKYVFGKRKEKSAAMLALGNPELGSAQMRLPFAEKEVRLLGAIYPDAALLIGNSASEANLKNQVGDYNIIHVASHGEYNAESPLLSCLRLSAGNGEDGRLEAREIFGLNIDAYLVSLSACNTAIGKLSKGDDVVGLTRAFIFAGTPSILGTIWSVNDQSTSILMKHFYSNLKTMDKLKSLQLAQIAMIDSEKYNHPYHWAGFQLIGDFY